MDNAGIGINGIGEIRRAVTYTMVVFGVTFGSVGQKGADSLHLRRSASCLAFARP